MKLNEIKIVINIFMNVVCIMVLRVAGRSYHSGKAAFLYRDKFSNEILTDSKKKKLYILI